MIDPIPDADRLRQRLVHLYGTQRGSECWQQILHQTTSPTERSATPASWDQRDVMLITYADQLQSPQETPLETLRQFLLSEQLEELFSAVHLLPFFPYSSDDGFSVIDYLQVDPHTGSWEDVERLGLHFSLMFDLVLNHISQHSRWFQDYLVGESPHDRFFIECDPTQNLSLVTRPRSSPLLTPFSTSRGLRHLWTTFSPDQIDLNYREPAVLVEMLRILLEYVQRGARIIRLDAIAYLWKEIGTTCIHHPKTHEVVKLMRDLLRVFAPDVWLLTETNVPHAENVSYFGDGDEAHMVYQFSLPPLLLDAFLQRDARPIHQWLRNLDGPPPGATYFNFTASHDGIGVRPLEGLISADRREQLLRHVKQQGGLVSERVHPDGSHSVYEMNITYLDALADPQYPNPRDHATRFLASQAVMLALQGIPGVYFHSLVGSPNDFEAAQASGQARKINRPKYLREQLQQRMLDSPLQSLVFAGYRHLLRQRITQPAFHPDADQEVIETRNDQLLVFRRIAREVPQQIVVATNFGDQPCELLWAQLPTPPLRRDLITDRDVNSERVTVGPSSTVWLTCDEAKD